MALVQCPKCNESVSDRAQKCVHCGYVFRLKEAQPPPETKPFDLLGLLLALAVLVWVGWQFLK